MYSQKEHSYWYFGDQLGLHFDAVNNIQTINDSSLSSSNLGTANISDCSGNLLFYTNGFKVYNRAHQVMDEASGLVFGSGYNNVTIIKKPGDNNLYYLITFNGRGEMSNTDYYGIYYHIIDMDQNGGLGKVIQKNIMLTISGSCKLAVAKKKDSDEIWLVSHNFADKQFDVYLITDAAITFTSSFSSGNDSLQGIMKFDSSFTQFVATNKWDTEMTVYNNTSKAFSLYNFDNQTGIISNRKDLGYDYYRIPRGAEFSPNGKFLYVSYSALPFYPPSGNYYYFAGSLVQYDLQASNIDADKKIIKKEYRFSPHAMQLGKDGKIYISNFRENSLAAILDPDLSYPNCNFQDKFIFFDSNVREFVPNITKIVQEVKHTVQSQCEGYATQFDINYSGNVVWNFGDGTTAFGNSVAHTYASPGIYNISLNNVSTICSRFSVEIFPMPKQSLVPTQISICGNLQSQTSLDELKSELITLQGNNEFEVRCYATQNDCDTDVNPINTINLQAQQNVYIRIRHKRNTTCFLNTSLSLIGYQKPIAQMSATYIICDNSPVQLFAPPNYDAYLWNTGATSSGIQVSDTGNYEVTISENFPDRVCSTVLATQVLPSQAPKITYIDVQDFSNNNIITVLTQGNGDYEYSLDGIHYQSSNVFENVPTGIQQVWVNDKNGCGNDFNEVILLNYLRYFSPNQDGFNDKWHIKYSHLEENIQVLIYDRYNKLVKTISKRDPFWDGTYNGELLPADDYWFIITKNDGKQFRGHFSLIR